MTLLSTLLGWARKPGSTRAKGRTAGPRPLISPEVFRAPAGRVAEASYPDVVERLREVDPAAVLLYGGRGKWILGALWPFHRIREQTALKIQANLRKGFDTWDPFKDEWCRAARVGFRPIEVYSEKDLMEGYIVRDFRLRDWNWRTQTSSELFKHFQAGVDDELAALEADLAFVRDKLESDVHSIDRYTFRKAKGFHQRRAFPGVAASN